MVLTILRGIGHVVTEEVVTYVIGETAGATAATRGCDGMVTR